MSTHISWHNFKSIILSIIYRQPSSTWLGLYPALSRQLTYCLWCYYAISEETVCNRTPRNWQAELWSSQSKQNLMVWELMWKYPVFTKCYQKAGNVATEVIFLSTGTSPYCKSRFCLISNGVNLLMAIMQYSTLWILLWSCVPGKTINVMTYWPRFT